MVKNRGLATGRINCNNAKDLADGLWTLLTANLNAISLPHRNVDGWKKIWTDYKFNVRKRWERGATLSEIQEKIVHLANFKKNDQNTVFEYYDNCDTEYYDETDIVSARKKAKAKAKVSMVPIATAVTPPPPPLPVEDIIEEVLVSSDDDNNDRDDDDGEDYTEADSEMSLFTPATRTTTTTTTRTALVNQQKPDEQPKALPSVAAEGAASSGAGDCNESTALSLKRKMDDIESNMKTHTKLLKSMVDCLSKRVDVARRNCKVNEERLEVEKANLEVNNDIKQVLLQLLMKKENE